MAFSARPRIALAALLLAALGACESTDGTGTSGSGSPKTAESGTKRGSAGGFSATLSAELTRQDPSLAATTPAPEAAPAPAAPAAAPTPGAPAAAMPAAPTPAAATPA